MRLINAEKMRAEAIESCKFCHLNGSKYCREKCEINAITKLIDNAPTVTPPDDTFTRDELEAWLYANAANNLDGNKRDQLFADDCAEIIKRLDGFERFVKDRREGKI